MARFLQQAFLLVTMAAALAACNAATGGIATTPTTPPSEPGATKPPVSSYPRMGTAPDYSWIAGRVEVTRIQGGCVYISTQEEPPTPVAEATPEGGAGPKVIVGTSVRNDTSPPLSEMTPAPPGSRAAQPPTNGRFVPGGPGWDESKVKDGDYVILFGHLAAADEPREVCPGGAAYSADRLQLNP